MNGTHLRWTMAAAAGLALVFWFGCERQDAQEAPAFGWRLDGTGCFPKPEPPLKWDVDKKEGIVWKAKVGSGYSSPVIAGERVFVNAEMEKLVCVSGADGKVLWEKINGFEQLPEEIKVEEKRYPSDAGYATATPVTDGKRVWASYGTGIVVCFDLEGNRQWVRYIDTLQKTEYGRTASPLLVGGRLLVTLGHLQALDAETGKTLWEAKDAAPAYGSPVRGKIGNVDVALTPTGDCVRVSDGRILAKGLGSLEYSSPVVNGNVVYYISPTACAVELPVEPADAIETKKLWEADLEGEFFSSPVHRDGTVYVCSNEGTLYALNAKTGETVYQRQLDIPSAGGIPGMEPANIYPSLAIAGKCLYLGNDTGTMLVLEPGAEYKEVGRNLLDEGSGACFAFDEKNAYLRGGEMLYKVGPK